MYTLNCYINTVTLKLYRTHELVERRNKCGLFVNTLISTAALIREIKLFSMMVRRLFESSGCSSSGA